MKSVSKKSLTILCVVCFLASVSLVVAVPTITYLLGTSEPSDTVTVVDGTVTIPLGVSVSATTISTADPLTITITATGSDASHASGMTVNVYEGTTKVGTATFSGTTATCVIPANTLAKGDHTFVAKP